MEQVIKIGLPDNFHPLVQFPRLIPQNYPGSNHLPPSIRLRMLNYTIHRIVNQGGSDVASVVRRLVRMALVCRKWKRVAYREREKGWMKAGHEGMSNSLGKGARLHDYLQDAPSGKRCVGGALTLVVVVCEPGRDVSDRHRAWDKHLVDVARACSNTKSLMMEVNNGRRLNLAGEFNCLEKLYISSAQTDLSVKIFKPIESIFHPLPRTLTRLDLARIDIPTWDAYLPTVKTLTLNHINFGRESSPQNRLINICQRFFASFPSLEALGLEGLGRMDSIAFTLLKPFRLSHLSLGYCVFPEGAANCRSGIKKSLVESLARHFRCKIKHLTLPNIGAGSEYFRALLESREDGMVPIYLRGLETIKVAAEGYYCPSMSPGRYAFTWDGEVNEFQCTEELEFVRLTGKHQICHPWITRWEPEEAGQELARWEPKEWA